MLTAQRARVHQNLRDRVFMESLRVAFGLWNGRCRLQATTEDVTLQPLFRFLRLTIYLRKSVVLLFVLLSEYNSLRLLSMI